MGKEPLKENTNVYFQARKRAAMSNDRLFSRENAAELLGISPYTLADYELGNTKVVPVDKVVLMADLYNAPELITGYCKYQCPIHGFMPLATEEKNLQGIALRLLKGLNEDEMQDLKTSMIDILEDGKVSDNELVEFKKLMEHLDGLAEIISELKLAGEKILKGSHTVCSTVRIPGQRTVSVWWRVSGITSYDNGCVSASTDCAGSP